MRPRTTLNCPICGHPEAQDSRQFLKMVFVAAHMTLCVNYKKNLVLFPPPQSALLFPSSRFSVSLGPRSIRPCWHDDGGGTGHEEEVGRREQEEEESGRMKEEEQAEGGGIAGSPSHLSGPAAPANCRREGGLKRNARAKTPDDRPARVGSGP